MSQSPRSGRFHVGAAVGSGMAAQAVEQAGADFILALGASRLRSMGLSSPAALLPIYDATEFSIDFAVSELLPRTTLPVYIGLPLFDPRLKADTLVDRLTAAGIVGLSNFPAVFHMGQQAETLKRNGLGLDREIAFLRAAQDAGLDTMGYVRNRTDASAMVGAGIRTLCINFGLNPAPGAAVLEDESDQIGGLELMLRDIVGHVRRPNRDLRIFLGGGPVSGGASLDRLCRRAGIDGFVGGSAMDRAPLEKSLLNSVQSFREIEVLQHRVERLERRLQKLSHRHGIVCRSAAMNEMMDRLEAIAAAGFHAVISGEAGSGQRKIAELLAERIGKRRSKAPWQISTQGNAAPLEQLFGETPTGGSRRLVGMMELSDAHTPVIFDTVLDLSGRQQVQLAEYIATGQYRPLPDGVPRIGTTRIIMLVDGALEDLRERGLLAPALFEALQGLEIGVPPLRERIEDIPELAGQEAERLAGSKAALNSDLVRTLLRHTWPGNLTELNKALAWLTRDGAPVATEAELAAWLGAAKPGASTAPGTISQRDRIIQALLVNNLNRSKTAEQLGITRKTLYNQIRRYGILT